MRQTPAPKRLLNCETLEDRSNPTNGVPWLDPTSLSLSFAPDGTDISGTPSSAFALLGASSPATWQREILRAYQTWAVQTNLNVGLTADGGQPLGAAGAPQEDTRFGDIRIGARPLSKDQLDSVAGASGFSHAGGTWSGDMVFNTKFTIGLGHSATQHDLFTIAVHEAGNSLGLIDNRNDNSAVMYPRYQGKAVTGLAASDIAAVQKLYGVRSADKYEGAGGNGEFGTAYNLTANGNLTAITGDVTQLGDADVYKFTTPSLLSGATKLTVDLKTAGLSLFTGKVTVYDANQNVIGTATATDPLANNVSVSIANYQPGTTYFVRVEGTGTDVFSAGAYNLHLSYNLGVGLSAITTLAPYINYEGWFGNATQTLAQTLNPLSAGNLSTFAVGGLLTSANDVDWFRFTPATSTAGTLTLSAWAYNGSPVLPAVQVYDAQGVQLPSEVVANDNGLFTVQIPNRGAGATYFAKVTAADPAGTRATGLYVLGTNLGNHAPTVYDALTSGTLTAAQSKAYATLTVNEARLTQFTLSATGGAGVAAAVRATIFDAAGRQVFTLAANADQTLSTGAVWLQAGTYSVVYNAATKLGGTLPNLAFVLRKWERSNPIDPLPIDPTSPPPPPPPSGEVVVTDPNPQPPPGDPPPPVPPPYPNT